jgi:hypothetical protein
MGNSAGNAIIAQNGGNGLSGCNQACLVSFPDRTTRVLCEPRVFEPSGHIVVFAFQQSDGGEERARITFVGGVFGSILAGNIVF